MYTYAHTGGRPAAYACKGSCQKLSTRKYPPKGCIGGRYCTTCEIYFTKDIVDEMKKQIYCPCCGYRTRGRITTPKAKRIGGFIDYTKNRYCSKCEVRVDFYDFKCPQCHYPTRGSPINSRGNAQEHFKRI